MLHDLNRSLTLLPTAQILCIIIFSINFALALRYANTKDSVGVQHLIIMMSAFGVAMLLFLISSFGVTLLLLAPKAIVFVTDEMAALRATIDQLETRNRAFVLPRVESADDERRRSRERPVGRSRFHSASPTPRRNVCYYHRMFGAEAIQCKQPCDY